jgi:membrane AbrB-like protein
VKVPVSGRYWLGLGVATVLASLAAGAIGLPASSLFAGLLVGLAFALIGPVRLVSPHIASVGAQAVVGASLGAHVETETLASVGGHGIAVALVITGTLGISLVAGLAVARITGLDNATALLGLVAGGASGIVTMSRELGGDERLVAVMQYLRVFVVVTLAPLVVAVALPSGGGSAGAPGAPAAEGAGLPADVAFTAAACAAGLLAARHLRIPAGALLLSLATSAALTLTGVAGGAEVPGLVEDVAFAAIGVQVGLRFTSAQLELARSILPAVLGATAAVVAACMGLGALLASFADVPLLDAYLATTPGGIPAVLATAVGSGADTTFVLAVQTLRLLLMVVAAPPLVRLLAHRGTPRIAPGPSVLHVDGEHKERA